MFSDIPITSDLHSFDFDFVELIESIRKEFGDTLLDMQGIGRDSRDIVKFSDAFLSDIPQVSDISIDPTANVGKKSITHYISEQPKSLQKLYSLLLLYRKVKDIFGINNAQDVIKGIIKGDLFINDSTKIFMPYCYAVDLRNLLIDGMPFIQGGMHIRPPKRSDSFLMQVIQSTSEISNQISGAVSYPSLFWIWDIFFRQEYGNDYTEYLRDKDTSISYTIRNQFQSLIYSFNYPFRSGRESSFTNVSIMDRGFMEALAKDYTLPEGMELNIDSTLELSKYFFEYYTDINCKEGIFTFPVITLAISLNDEGNYTDPDFVDWVAEINAKKALGNIMVSKPSKFSSCCRLISDYESFNELGYINSFGSGGISIGSHRVLGINLPRYAYLPEKDLSKAIELVHMGLYAHREIIKEEISKGILPLYNHNVLSLKRQYSTVGIIGCYEYLSNKGLDICTEQGISTLTNVFKSIEESIKVWQLNEKKEGNLYNVEQIPGETLCVTLSKLDTYLSYNPNKYKMYSNQYIPLVREDVGIYERLRVQGIFDSHTTGGAICHLNIDDSQPLIKEQMRKLIDTALICKVVYFAVNYAFSKTVNGDILIGLHKECPITGVPIETWYTRVVGFLTNVSNWNTTRKEWEFPNRKFYVNALDNKSNTFQDEYETKGIINGFLTEAKLIPVLESNNI